jgi:hypothetical protein
MDARLRNQIHKALKSAGYTIESASKYVDEMPKFAVGETTSKKEKSGKKNEAKKPAVPDVFVVSFEIKGHGKVTLRHNNFWLFPYELPTFSLTNDCKDKFIGKPHVLMSGAVCAFESDTTTGNVFNPVAMFVDSLGLHKRVLEVGVSGKNKEDFLDEFQFYWTYDQESVGTLYNFANLGDKPKKIKCKTSGGRFIFLADTQSELKAISERCLKNIYAGALAGIADLSYDLNALFLPLSRAPKFPFPKTVKQWSKAVKELSPFTEIYEEFFANNRKTSSMVVFSIPYKHGKIYCAIFCNPDAVKTRFSLDVLKKEEMKTVVETFQFLKSLREIESEKFYDFLLENSKEVKWDKILRLWCNDMTSQRLITRGGDGRKVLSKAIVVGAGSVGSTLVNSLVKAGTEEITVIDNDVLKTENIARHICGFSYIGIPKVTAIQNYFDSDYPTCKVIAVEQDLHTVLEKNQKKLAKKHGDAIFLCTANYSTEQHLMNKFLDGDIKQPVVSLWIEPYGLAAHALVFNKPQVLAGTVFDNMLQFTKTVVKNASVLNKRESGCGSTYMPYSHANVEIFVNTVVQELAALIGKKRNFHFAWYGKITKAGALGAELAEEYKNIPDYSFTVEEL